MSYTPTEWKRGDVVTSEKLNKMEQGISEAGSGGALVATEDSDTAALDKTWQEIADADFAVVKFATDEGWGFYLVGRVESGADHYSVIAQTPSGGEAYTCDTSDGYPVYTESNG